MNSVEMKSVAKELQSITVGDPTHFGGLTIFPLFRNGSAPAEPGYTLLEEAIGRGTASITELGAGGSVPELRFENLGETAGAVARWRGAGRRQAESRSESDDPGACKTGNRHTGILRGGWSLACRI